ncbi:beta-phosphoglucomutase [Cohnella phaseoli]|uniref:Beta-phosphoglucomutase n=1 Tax=Cohnella phaseoli TaxID=456490 RepID=A0A3D9I140_9BACL|nr:beta-phosphoglucomutase [Cohnella phaseoli]RED54866.1 beta-phosphoglucomutase [Cohnella phaseoli]
MNIQACLFDLDGVICDTAKYHFQAWKRLADELGFVFTLEDNERLKGVSRRESLDIVLEVGCVVADEKAKGRMAERKNEWYVESISRIGEEELLEGVKPFLESLRKAGIRVALGSASKNADLILDRLRIKGYFDAIIDGTKIAKAKPDPEVFLEGAKAVGVEPSRCIVFEDAVAGIEAAKNARMKCVGVGRADLLRAADLVIPSFVGVDLSLLDKLA